MTRGRSLGGKVVVAVSISAELARKLDDHAKRSNKPRSRVVEEALEEFFKRAEAPAAGAKERGGAAEETAAVNEQPAASAGYGEVVSAIEGWLKLMRERLPQIVGTRVEWCRDILKKHGDRDSYNDCLRRARDSIMSLFNKSVGRVTALLAELEYKYRDSGRVNKYYNEIEALRASVDAMISGSARQ